MPKTVSCDIYGDTVAFVVDTFSTPDAIRWVSHPTHTARIASRQRFILRIGFFGDATVGIVYVSGRMCSLGKEGGKMLPLD